MVSLQSLYNSRAKVQRVQLVEEDGSPTYSWKDVNSLQYMSCRFDVGFLRPGKDQPMAVEAGKVPPRFGVFYCDSYAGIISGDRITFVKNTRGQIPVTGTFEVRVPPDEAQDYSGAHHIEVQIIEVAQQVVAGERQFPGGVS